jgi:uncharacterized membrane protein YbhN (UPF0104 family)
VVSDHWPRGGRRFVFYPTWRPVSVPYPFARLIAIIRLSIPFSLPILFTLSLCIHSPVIILRFWYPGLVVLFCRLLCLALLCSAFCVFDRVETYRSSH